MCEHNLFKNLQLKELKKYMKIKYQFKIVHEIVLRLKLWLKSFTI